MAQKKIRTLELARAGKWGLDGSEITKQDIAEMAETFAGKRPVIIGHGVTDRAPKFGDVLDCWPSTDGNSIIGPVIFSEIGDKLYEEGYYDGWSISMPRRSSDNKRVLHHLAILGAVPPKIPNLEELAQVAVDFGASTNGEDAAKNRYQFSGKIPEREDNDTMTDEEKKAMADKEAKIAELEAKNKALEEASKKAAEAPPATEPATPAGAAAGGDVAANADFADVQKELAAIKADRRRERLEVFGRDITEKVPAGIATKAKALAGQVEAIGAFDFSDNGKTEKRDALQLLGEILRGWPEPVRTGASGINYGDSNNGEKPVDWAGAAKKM